jgi:hypothetical protein
VSTVWNRLVFSREHAQLDSDCLCAGAGWAVERPDRKPIEIDCAWSSSATCVTAVFIVGLVAASSMFLYERHLIIVNVCFSRGMACVVIRQGS